MFPRTLQDDASNLAPGQLLHDLERRQDEVLRQLDDLEAKLASVLRGLNIEPEMADNV